MLHFTGERFIPTRELMNDEIGFEHLHRYSAVIPFIKNKVVLDIACGEGYGTALMGKHAQKVFGVDIDQECIQWASEQYSKQNDTLVFKKGTVDRIPLPGQEIDVVVSFETIEHVDAAVQQLFMQEVKRVLKPGGMLIMSTPNTANYTERYDHNNEFHVKEFQKEEFHHFLSEHFSHVYHFQQGYEIVSTITSDNLETVRQLQVHNWERDLKEVNRKYLISIASNKEVPNSDDLSSAVLQVDKDFLGLIDYIVSLQKQEQALQTQLGIVQQLQEKVAEQQAIIADHQEKIAEQHAKIAEQQESIDKLSGIVTDKDNIIVELNHRMATILHNVDQLNVKISEIYDSEGWKMLSIYYRLREKIIPQNSKRYNSIKKIINKLRNKKGDNVVITDFTTPFPPPVTEEPDHYDIIEFPVFEQPKVSIVIPVYNGWEMNYKCLHSLKQNTFGVSYEVIIADDCSTDETKDIKDYVKNITVVRNETNLGFLKNCNHAATFAKGTYIHFLNNDTVVAPGWLGPLVELMDKDPQIGIVGSKLIYPDGRLQEAGGIIWQDASGWNFGHKQNPDAPEYNYVKEVDYISGASILVRKELWKKLGGFDEYYSPAYCEDSDLAFAARSMNMKVVYQPLSVVVHYEGFSHGSEANKDGGLTNIKSYQQINNVKFAQKWEKELLKQPPNAVDVFHARDRSYNKKTILVIDHYVPQFDRDAGSKTTFQYLNLFVEMGLNVKFIGDNFYKHEPYTTVLQQKGIEVLYGSYYAQTWVEWVEANKDNIDFVFLNRPHVSIKYIWHLRNKIQAKIFYYCHDLHFVRELQAFEITRDENRLALSNEWKQVEYELFNQSDVILTPSLKEKALLENDFPADKVKVMPAFFYPEIAAPITNFEERTDILFVGGFTHSPNADAVMWFISSVLPDIIKQIPALRVIIVGSNVPDDIMSLASANVIIKGFVSEVELNLLYNRVRLSIIPLRYGAGLKGKTVEAMAKGLPVVSTSFGLEGLEGIEDILQPYDTEADFAKAVISLYNDTSKLEQLSERIVAYAKNNFTKDSARLFFRSLFEV